MNGLKTNQSEVKQLDDAFMIKRLKRDDEGALKQIYEQYFSYVSAITYSRIGAKMQKEDAEEVIADVFLALWENRKKLSAEYGTLKSYLGVLTRNLSINKLRNFHFSEELMEAEIFSKEMGVEESFLQKETLQEIYQLVMAMKSPDKEIFFNYYLKELSIKEVATMFDIKENTIKTKLRRVRKKVQSILKERGSHYEYIQRQT